MKKYVTRENACVFPPDHPDLIWRLFSFCCVAVLNMAASRLFSQLSDDYLTRFPEEHENENTRKKSVYDLSIFREYFSSIDEPREIELLSFSPLENNIHIFAPPCNILYILALEIYLDIRCSQDYSN